MIAKLRIQRRMKRLLESWVALRDLVRSVGAETQPAQVDEDRFLALKAEIAREVAWVEALIPGGLRLDAVRSHRRMNDAMARFLSLSAVSKASPTDREAFEAAWHDGYLFLNKIKGMGPTPPVRDRGARRARVLMGVPRHRSPRPEFGLWLVRFVLQAAFLVLILYLITRAIGLRYAGGGHWAFEPPTSIGGVWANVWGGLMGVLGRSGDVFAPVVAQYGIEVTIFFVGLLLVTAGYWVFVRSR